MKTVGVIGLGDMGLGMAKSLLRAGFSVVGLDVRDEPLAALEALGGRRASHARELGAECDAVFIMVLNGEQVEQVVTGDDGLPAGLRAGSTVILSSTILPADARDLGDRLEKCDVRMIDSPVAGGGPKAHAGELTPIVACPRETLEAERDVLEAVSAKIVHVGEEIGMGQTAKAALQALVGATFAGIFEALVLGSKAGIPGETMYEVISSSGVASPLFEYCARPILDRRFKNTGSQITTMYKDLGLTMAVAREVGVPMFTTAAAYELFQAGISSFPDEDNWAVVKVLERIAGTEVRW